MSRTFRLPPSPAPAAADLDELISLAKRSAQGEREPKRMGRPALRPTAADLIYSADAYRTLRFSSVWTQTRCSHCGFLSLAFDGIFRERLGPEGGGSLTQTRVTRSEVDESLPKATRVQHATVSECAECSLDGFTHPADSGDAPSLDL